MIIKNWIKSSNIVWKDGIQSVQPKDVNELFIQEILEKLQQEIKINSEQFEKCQEQISKQSDENSKMEKEITAQKDKNDKIDRCQKLQEEQKVLQEKQEDINKNKNLINELEREVEVKKKEFELLENEIKKISSDILEIERENLAYKLRSELKDGDICPVCGSAQHHKENIKHIEFKESIKFEEEKSLKEKCASDLDNGHEFLNYDKIEISKFNKEERRTIVYYTDPYSSWQKGMNENCNGILRRFIPKGTDLNKISNEKLEKILSKINGKPRKISGFISAEKRFNEEIEKIVLSSIDEIKPTSMKDMGLVMKKVGELLVGKNADMSLVSKLVKEKIMSN